MIASEQPRDRTLVLHMHPLSSYCWKVLIALYECEIPFEPALIRGRPAEQEVFRRLWPIAKMPLLHDEAREQSIPESSIIIEYLQQHYCRSATLIPADAAEQLEARLWDRFFDLYVHAPMQKLVGDHMRPEGQKDPTGAAEARATLGTAYAMLEERMKARSWVAGSAFTLADCAAVPALFYAAAVRPFGAPSAHLAAYFERLLGRKSVQSVIAGARPYFHLFPLREALDPRFTLSK